MSKVLVQEMFAFVCKECLSSRLMCRDKQLNTSYNLSYLGRRLASTEAYSSSSSDSESDTDRGDERPDTGRYPHHIPTTPLQKALLSVGAAAVAISRPWRGDMVAALGETTGQLALVRMRSKMLQDATGSLILQEQPRITTHTVDLDYLRGLPESTLGKAYVSWLDLNRASPDEREPVHFVDDPDLAYVMQRYRETHDLYHTILGMPTNMLGEIAVKWVEAIQLGLPMCLLGALFGPVRLGPKHMELYLKSHLWWAIRNGQNAKFLMNVYYEKHWDWPLEELRQHLNIEAPPSTPERKHQT